MNSTILRLSMLSALFFSFGNGGCSCSDTPQDIPDAGLDALGSDAPGSDAPGGDAPGSDAPGSDAPGSDAPEMDAPVPVTCGDGVEDEGEECDDGNDSDDDFCLSTCRFACGDGFVNAAETCDTAIADGEPGACPASCDDANACTSDVLSGSACTATCMNGPITACAPDDGCCADGCTALDDNDCSGMCGNGTIEPGETCEGGVGDGCPTSCDDGNACTMNQTAGSAADCDIECSFPPIAMCVNGDGCCAPGCDSTTDDDCSSMCGNGTIEDGETCEGGVGDGCPASCDDGRACTADSRTGTAANCNVMCTNTRITTCISDDGCCRARCNELNDNDCAPVCGNTVMETGEDCDDGNADATDGCDMCVSTGTDVVAFRLTDLDLRDPHAFASVFGCRDITNTVFGMPGINPSFQTAIQTDDDGDGLLDLSFVMAFDTLDQGDGATGAGNLIVADCTAPMSSTSCSGGDATAVSYRSRTSGTCLDIVPGTVRPYTPAVVTPSAPCFATAPTSLILSLGGIVITLQEAQIGASYVGTPASSLSNGLIRGFITEADAVATILPMALPIVGGDTLASVLRGGPGNCSAQSDMDTHPALGDGWWFYMNFPAASVPYTP